MKEALKLALEALQLSAVTVDNFGVQKKTNEAITAIKEALAQPEQSAEPLTDERIVDILGEFPFYASEWNEEDYNRFARAIEAAHGIKE